MGKVHHRKPFTVGCLGLTAIRRDEKVRLVEESAPDVKGVERPQGMMFEAADGLLEDIDSLWKKVGPRVPAGTESRSARVRQGR